MITGKPPGTDHSQQSPTRLRGASGRDTRWLPLTPVTYQTQGSQRSGYPVVTTHTSHLPDSGEPAVGVPSGYHSHQSPTRLRGASGRGTQWLPLTPVTYQTQGSQRSGYPVVTTHTSHLPDSGEPAVGVPGGYHSHQSPTRLRGASGRGTRRLPLTPVTYQTRDPAVGAPGGYHSHQSPTRLREASGRDTRRLPLTPVTYQTQGSQWSGHPAVTTHTSHLPDSGKPVVGTPGGYL